MASATDTSTALATNLTPAAQRQIQSEQRYIKKILDRFGPDSDEYIKAAASLLAALAEALGRGGDVDADNELGLFGNDGCCIWCLRFTFDPEVHAAGEEWLAGSYSVKVVANLKNATRIH